MMIGSRSADLRSWLAVLLFAPLVAMAQTPAVIAVRPVAQAPKIDGNLAEWGKDGWARISVKPALDDAERSRFGFGRADDQTGSLIVEVKAAVHAGRFYVALKYPDAAADVEHRLWQWRGDKYADNKQREDMLALRFHISGDFDRSMLSTKAYTVDVWLWSAARTNPGGIAEDLSHHISTAMQENAAEHVMPDGKTIYIKKSRDAGNPPYKLLPRPKEFKGDKLPSFESATASGSSADVAAKGEWKSGHWQLEFGRALDTGHADDVIFAPGKKVLGQIAVFNRGYAEQKSVSEPLLFDFSAIR
jgi:hypothetical protein